MKSSNLTGTSIIFNTMKSYQTATLYCVNFSYRNLLWRPWIQVDRFYTRHMHTEIAMNCCTTNTEKDPKIPRCPSGTWKCTKNNNSCYI